MGKVFKLTTEEIEYMLFVIPITEANEKLIREFELELARRRET